MSVKVALKLSTADNVSLTTDLWTDVLNSQSFIDLTVHFIQADKHESITLGVIALNKQHTASNIGEWIFKMLEKWKITKEQVFSIVTDNAANISLAAVNVFGASKHMGCFAHKLNLVVANSFKSTQSALIIKKIKKIVGHFKHCVNDYDKLKEKTDYKVINSVETRWNSTFYMIERFVLLADFITIVLLENKDAPEMLTALERYSAQEFLSILKPFEIATKISSGEKYVTASKIIPIVEIIGMKLKEFVPKSEAAVELKNSIVNNFENRFSDIQKDTKLVIATLLDLRYKNLYIENSDYFKTAINSINSEMQFSEENVDELQIRSENMHKKNKDEDDFWSHHDDLIEKKMLTLISLVVTS